MEMGSTKPGPAAGEANLFAGDAWFDPLEASVRMRIRGFIEGMLASELDAALSRRRYERRPAGLDGVGRADATVGSHQHGHRERGLTGTFGTLELRNEPLKHAHLEMRALLRDRLRDGAR